MAGGQAIEGYICICGETFDDLNQFRGHLITASRAEKGAHKSAGRVNMETGEVTLPPWDERTQEQKQSSRYAKKSDKGKARSDSAARVTTDPSIAQEIKFVPRVYTADYSPIMRAGQAASQREWGWRNDMPLGTFLDTVIYHFFLEHGIRLAGYIVEELEEPESDSEPVEEMENDLVEVA